jgi:predicted transcriptional regulator
MSRKLSRRYENMALKTIRIRLKSLDKSLDEAVATMKAIRKGRRAKPRKGEYFESLEAARSLLTENRLSLLRAIRLHAPESVAELARLVKRDFRHVHGDLELLQNLGLVKASSNRQGKPSKLTTDTTEIVFKIAV